MIFVVDHEENGEPVIDVIHGAELDIDRYQKVNSIFFCDNVDEVMFVIAELRNWDQE